jgi:plastocyanin
VQHRAAYKKQMQLSVGGRARNALMSRERSGPDEKNLMKSRKKLDMIRKFVCIASLLAVVMVVMVLLLAASPNVTANTQQSATTAEVKIDNFSFSPTTITVAVGTTVTWTNRDDIPHTVVSSDDSKALKSKVMDTDEKFSFTFTKPGTFPYFCSVHPKMTGTVVVK